MHRYQGLGLEQSFWGNSFNLQLWRTTQIQDGERATGQTKKKKKRRITHIPPWLWGPSPHLIMRWVISKQKLDMPKAINGLSALLGQSVRQECAVGWGGGVNCKGRWPLPLKLWSMEGSRIGPGRRPATPNAHRHLPNISLLSSKRENLAWRSHHGFK